MIKVLEEKEVPKKQITCSNCGSELEYGNADLHEDYMRNQKISNNISWPPTEIPAASKYYEIVCPVCGCKVSASWIIRRKDSV